MALHIPLIWVNSVWFQVYLLFLFVVVAPVYFRKRWYRLLFNLCLVLPLFQRRLTFFSSFPFCTIFVKILWFIFYFLLVELKSCVNFKRQLSIGIKYLKAVAFAVLWVADFSASWWNELFIVQRFFPYTHNHPRCEDISTFLGLVGKEILSA